MKNRYKLVSFPFYFHEKYWKKRRKKEENQILSAPQVYASEHFHTSLTPYIVYIVITIEMREKKEDVTFRLHLHNASL